MQNNQAQHEPEPLGTMISEDVKIISTAVMSTPVTPFKLSLTPGTPLIEAIHGPGARIVNSCTAFAESAGFESWQEAVEAMRGGQIVHGRGPRMGNKSIIDIQLFSQAVSDAGMRMKFVGDMGMVAVGLPDHIEE